MTTSADAQQDQLSRVDPAPGQTEIVRELSEAAELVRERHVAMTAAIDDRNRIIRRAVDDYRLSHRQVARATGLSLGRVEGVLAND